MKICIPSEENKGMDSPVYGHVGSAPYFVVYDSDTKTFSVIDNNDIRHQHGRCNPLRSFENTRIDVMITRNIGQGALRKLNSGGVKVYRASNKRTAAEAVKSFENREMRELTIDDVCNHDGEHHHGEHHHDEYHHSGHEHRRGCE
jgi:predicted Fe-Mo cluster-binding NifX family protein